ncbi:MAG: hypothetical protein EON91_08615 [Brevundimonas sp.]|uniref:hypothetical protein n=1 Tax=Brevundimonas sp. TaxID=1871086 RepID=UPI00121A30EC|nr:hypothetical protein [Brevundimonas sp.]RZJ17651.1 MAG: hypothetical protein EON91_08615 [Brevundimonas sp.]
MTGRPLSARASLEGQLNFGLLVLWSVVLWRTGLVAAGYALLAFLADLQALIGRPLPQTLHTRHPYGSLIELSAAGLRHAWWIEPHLDHARRMFILGSLGSLLLWLFQELVWFRRRLHVDPIFAARIDGMFERGEAWVSRRLRTARGRLAEGLVLMVRRQMQAGALPARIVRIARLRSPNLEERRKEGLPGEPAADRQGEHLSEYLVDRTASVDPSQPGSCEAAGENHPTQHSDEQLPTSQAAPYPSSFFTRF